MLLLGFSGGFFKVFFGGIVGGFLGGVVGVCVEWFGFLWLLRVVDDVMK